MTQSSSAEPIKLSSSAKRKGIRNVYTLTPSQLARKRATDREAQRAIRARTKEHIERLEREIEDLRVSHVSDKTVQELLRRNKALNDELCQLRRSMGIFMTLSPHSTSAPAIEHAGAFLASPSQQPPAPCQSACNQDNYSAVQIPKMSLLPYGRAYYIPNYNQTTPHSVPMPNCEAWTSAIPSSVPSLSPSVNTDVCRLGSRYISTSVHTSLMSTNGISLLASNEVKMEFEGMHNMMAAQCDIQQTQRQRNQDWNMYVDDVCQLGNITQHGLSLSNAPRLTPPTKQD
ncbi:hypothetical protein X797_012490 [Metarhizium robertsii]|uniref:BZIP transcription factor n=2 Tax=Metarhizium robertsii TaxID=568076 RepID=E9EJT8_METRA|nr:bZIP transcription factor [Metarhizium robertsii ARSEF 23]EFZ03823.1 bZIP transcription factor [Metarhizium robertsii ARSEF 23]EXU94439.1 hypothetical protein X797_012490 [Metarhizium robertsii]